MSDTLVFPAQDLQDLGVRLFAACGAPPAEAATVAEDLVEASLMGLESHGVTRYIMYVEEVLAGRIRPGAPVRVVRDTPTLTVLDCGLNFGQVGAARLVEAVAVKARQAGVAYGVTQRCHHVGRLGGHAQKVAAQGLFCLAVANSHKHGHFVVPWGGREGRLATNPLAWAVPTGGLPVVLDMSTSMIAEGKIRALMHAGQSVPPGRILDGHGRPTTEPRAFYGPPRGTILPLGGELGYKGFGLGLLVEVLGSTLAGEPLTDEHRYVNGLGLLAIDPEPLCGASRFRTLVDELCAYVTSSPPAPGFEEVVLPGALDFRQRERRLREGIPLPAETWRQIEEVARRVGVSTSE
ncbi:MAG: Ldh family oxidoreductase [Candidatus Latescibacterota bacterium]